MLKALMIWVCYNELPHLWRIYVMLLALRSYCILILISKSVHLIPENAAYRGSSLGFGKKPQNYLAHLVKNQHCCMLHTCWQIQQIIWLSIHAYCAHAHCSEYVFPKLKRALSLFPHIVFIHTNLVQADESKLWDAVGCWFVFGTRSVPQTSLRVCSSPELVPPPACGSSRLDSASGSGSDTTTWWASCDWGPPGNLKGVMGEF